MTIKTTTIRLLPLACALLLGGCMVGPDYQRPAVAMPQAWKERPGWTLARPAAEAPKGDWWSAFGDPLLDRLEPQVSVSNQTVRQSYADYEQALAEVNVARAGLFPVIGGSLQYTHQHTPSGSTNGNGQTTTTSGLEANASWAPDLWGQVRRQVQESSANAQASQALLANATLSEQVALAEAVIDLRVVDADRALLERTVAAYRQFLQVVQAQAQAGTATPSALASARAQLESAQADLISLAVTRAQYAHAIAVLVGRDPESLSIARTDTLPKLPLVDAGLPSTLLQRRPDVAAAERQMAAANAAIGVATAAYYPTLSLSAAAGWTLSPLSGILRASNEAWSLGASAGETLFDGGQRNAQVAAARAAYDASVASYRGTVLGALQNVENDLVGLRVLALQADALDAAVHDAREGASIAQSEFQAGTVDYTTVATALVTQFGDEQSALNVRQQRLLDTAALIGDLGGGWPGLSSTHAPQQAEAGMKSSHESSN